MSKTIIFKEGYPKTTRKNLFEDDGKTPLSIGNSEDTLFKYIGKTTDFINSVDNVSCDNYSWGIGCVGEASFGKCEAGITTSSVADIKPVTYENGQIIIDNNYIYLTCSTRTTYSGALIYKMCLGTYKMELVGNILYENNGVYHAHYVCSSLMFDRNIHLWVVTTDFWDGDKLMYYGTSSQDLRFGYNVVHVEQIDYQNKTTGDEDQFIMYDDNIDSELYGKWLLIHTRVIGGNYGIVIQKGESIHGPFTIHKTISDVSYTGVFLQRVGGTPYLISGTRIDSANDEYRVLSYPNLEILGTLSLDALTGGWGGWGSFFAIPHQNDTKYMLVTFDRGNTSNFDNWTYGATHVYVSEERNRGLEYPIKMQDDSIIESNIHEDYKPWELHMKREWANTFYFRDWLGVCGFNPLTSINRAYSNELVLSNAVATYSEGAITIKSTSSGYATIGRYKPLCSYRLRIKNINGNKAIFWIGDISSQKVRKLTISINTQVIKISSSDNIADTQQTYSDEISYVANKDYIELIIGVNPKSFSIVIN